MLVAAWAAGDGPAPVGLDMSFITTPLLRVLRLGSRKEKGHCRCLRRPADEEQIQETKHLTELSCYRTAVSSQQSGVSS